MRGVRERRREGEGWRGRGERDVREGERRRADGRREEIKHKVTQHT